MTYRSISLKAAVAKNLRPQTWTAEDVYAILPEDGSTKTFWESFGHVGGSERFATHYMRRSKNGIEIIRRKIVAGEKVWPADVVMIHPLGSGRRVRLLVR